MSDTTDTTATGDPAPPASTAPAGRTLAFVGLGAVLAGGGLGHFVLSPRLAPSAPSAAQEDVKETSGGHGPASAAGEIFTIGNLIINPAGSMGTRFLMVTVGIAASSPKDVEHLREQEIPARDAIGVLLESMSLDILTAPGARDRLRHQLAEVLSPLAGPGAQLQVYLPQFVIQ